MYARRAVLLRRVVGDNPEMKKMADEIMEEYARTGEPGIYQGDRQLSEKVVGRGPGNATKEQRSQAMQSASAGRLPP